MNLIVVAERSCKLFKKRNRLDIREFAFSNGIVDTWNALSRDSVNCTSIKFNAFIYYFTRQNKVSSSSSLKGIPVFKMNGNWEHSCKCLYI